MEPNLHIKNIGKLKDANIRIGRFTVLAGPNNSGKSFVSKLLYSVFNAMNANHAEVCLHKILDPVEENLTRWHPKYRMGGRKLPDKNLVTIFEEVQQMKTTFSGLLVDDVEKMTDAIPGFRRKIKHMNKLLGIVRESMSKRRISRMPDDWVARYLKRLATSLDELQRFTTRHDVSDFIRYGLEDSIVHNLVQNFQVATLSELEGESNSDPSISVSDLGNMKVRGDAIYFQIESAGIKQLQQYSKVLYLESPIHWKLRSALENLHYSPRFHFSERVRVTGVPGYFYDLAQALNERYGGKMSFPDLYEQLTSKEVMDGKVALSDSGELLFQENGSSFSLPITATGVVNLGILALLIEHKILDGQSVLFIDEPEAHLHPAWQVEMAKALFALAKGGAHVVIATHSVDMLKWLEVHVKKNPKDAELIALNKFSTKGVVDSKQDIKDALASIKKELTKPFADLYTAGL